MVQCITLDDFIMLVITKIVWKQMWKEFFYIISVYLWHIVINSMYFGIYKGRPHTGSDKSGLSYGVVIPQGTKTMEKWLKKKQYGLWLGVVSSLKFIVFIQ